MKSGPRQRKPSDRRDDALVRADAALVNARELFVTANLAHARGNPDAAGKTRQALDAVELARAELRRLADEAEATR